MKMKITGPSEVVWPADHIGNLTYEVTVEGDPPRSGSVWVRQDVYDIEDADLDLAQYQRVTDGKATMTLGETPSWPNPPGGGGIIELQLINFGNRARVLDRAEATLVAG